MELLDRKILYFLKVVEKGSFSGAARELYLTQPALSKQISKLEEELGFALLDRSGYRPLLTPKGERFYRECVKLERRCREILSQLRASDSPSINIGFTGAYENREILTFLKEYTKRQGVAVNFLRKDFEQCLDDLLQGRVDVSFGIESTYRYSSMVEYEILHSYEMCVITSFAHFLAKKE